MTPQFTYCSRKTLKTGVQEYWRFRHPRTGEVRLPGRPGDPEFQRKYSALMEKACQPARLIDPRAAAERGDLQLETHHVYFIQRGKNGPVKIGYSKDPEKRLTILQTASSARLRLLAKLRGGARVEKILHEVLDEERVFGEWFAPSPRLLRFIADIRKGKFET